MSGERSSGDNIIDLRALTKGADTPPTMGKPLDSGGGGGNSGGMEARIQRLEDDFKEMKSDMKAIRALLTDIQVKLAQIEGRFTGLEGRISALPTALQLLGFAVAVFVAAGVFRFFEPRMFPAQPQPAAISAPTPSPPRAAP